jgi:hypothetical protein
MKVRLEKDRRFGNFTADQFEKIAAGQEAFACILEDGYCRRTIPPKERIEEINELRQKAMENRNAAKRLRMNKLGAA